MKTLRILFLLTLVSMAGFAQVPNGSFENWHPYALGEYPDGWMTSDSVAFALGGSHNAFKGTDPKDGLASLHLVSASVIIANGPGVATNGDIELAGVNFLFSGGSPDAVRHNEMNGWFKYIPQNALDTGLITVILKGDSAGFRDTIAIGVFKFTDTVTTYTPFVVQLNDFKTHDPDTCLIIIQSSKGINDANLGLGTELIIDSLAFSGIVGIDEQPNSIVNSVNIYPSPAHDQINLAVDLKKQVKMSCSIYDLTGREVITLGSVSEKETIDISSLAKGNYLLKLTDENKNQLYTKSFVKE